MKLKSLSLVFAMTLASAASAQPLASRSFDLMFVGDDPTESFSFLLPSSQLVPVNVTFDGYFENLNPDETGVRYGLQWFISGSTWDGVQLTGENGVRLPAVDPTLGTTRVPISFVTPVGYTPSETRLWVEGLGPTDRFRFVGEFSIMPVPEPKVMTLITAAALAAVLLRLRKETQ